MLTINQKNRKFLAHIALLAVVLLSLFATPRPVSANHLTVNTFTDEFGVNAAACSLREAIYAANTDAAFGGCPAGFGEDTIVLSPGTYELSIGVLDEMSDAADEIGAVGDLDITSSMRIVGAGADLTTIRPVNGAKTRIIHIASIGANVAIQQLTLTNGYAYRYTPIPNEPDNETMGGGIFNEFGRLTIWRATIVANKAHHSGGGVYSDREDSNTVFILDSTIQDNIAELGDGGGVLTESQMSIWRSLVWNNTAQGGNGGGIFNNEVLRMTAVTVTQNKVLSASGRGSGIYADGATDVFQSTIVHNISAARDRYGFEISAGASVLLNNIIAYNLSYIGGTYSSANCLFGQNVYGAYNYRNVDEKIPNTNNDICTGKAGTAGSFLVTNSGIGLSSTLELNQGWTKSYALLGSSSLIDKGQPQNSFRHPQTGTTYSCFGADQRWAPRPNAAGNICDPGAVEYYTPGQAFSSRQIFMPLLNQ